MAYDLLDLLNLPFRSRVVWLPFAFVFGAMVGSLLNVVILRLPRGKSLWWPSSRCGQCYQAIPGSLNLPLVTYLWLRGRCKVCGTGYSSRYFWIELLTATAFALLFWFDVVLDVRQIEPSTGWHTGVTLPLAALWAHHAVLLSCLLAATFIDLELERVPRSLLIFGTIAGLAGGVHAMNAAASSVLGAFFGGIVEWVARRLGPGSLPRDGGGWLLGMIGAYTGWQFLPLVVFVTVLTMPLGHLLGVRRPTPFVALGAMVTVVVGPCLARELPWLAQT
jgi:leader peptidase (prepilin peptidase)/N-methyltransferase